MNSSIICRVGFFSLEVMSKKLV